MKLLALLFLVGIVSCAPAEDTATPSKEDENLVVTSEFFPDEFVEFTGEHDIVKIDVPINGITLDTDDDTEVTLFFVEADVVDGKKDFKGLYVLNDKKATKLLDNGRDITSNDDKNVILFGASDGIYKYNAEKKTAEKYGTVTDSVLNIEKMKDTDVIYILTDAKELYKVTESGTKKEKVTEVTHAHEIMLDNANNLYFYGHDNVPHVVTEGGVKKIEGLPETTKEVRLIRPPFIYENGVVFLADDKPYMIFSNGTVENTDIVLQVKPTAYAPEATLLQYYGYNKKIYEINLLGIMLGAMLEELKNYLTTYSDAINRIAEESKKITK